MKINKEIEKGPTECKNYEVSHVFEGKFNAGQKGLALKTLLVIKQKNKRKLNSHFWFFGGFCYDINPTYVMLLDVGTKPKKKALYSLWKAMHVRPNVAGTCGEIVPD